MEYKTQNKHLAIVSKHFVVIFVLWRHQPPGPSLFSRKQLSNIKLE